MNSQYDSGSPTGEKVVKDHEYNVEAQPSGTVVEGDQRPLHRNLKGRHMQMIAMQVVSARLEAFLLTNTVAAQSVLVFSSVLAMPSSPVARLRSFLVS